MVMISLSLPLFEKCFCPLPTEPKNKKEENQ